MIRFEGDDQALQNDRTEGKFVFSITASGWHSGMLAFELGEEKDEKLEVTEDTKGVVQEEVGDISNEARGMPRVRGLRLGFPLRGMSRRGGTE